MIKYCLYANYVRSTWDGDYHFVSAPQLAALYNLPEGSWREHSTRVPQVCDELVHLGPRYDGDYALPAAR